MDLLSKSDEEIFKIGKPFWENLVRASNMKDYGGFTKDFSTQMLFGANEVELGKQWANNKIITNLEETYKPFGTLRRGDHITVLIKQTNKEIPGEFLGRLVLGVEDDEIKIFGATIFQQIFKICFLHKIYINKDGATNNHYDIQVGPNASVNIQIDKGDMNVVLKDGKLNTNVAGDYNMKIGGNMNLDVRGNKTETVSGSKTSNTTGNVIHRGARIDLNP